MFHVYHVVSQIKRILAPIPRDKEGKIKIKDFISLDIHSEDAFDVRFGFISTIFSKIVITVIITQYLIISFVTIIFRLWIRTKTAS